LSWNANIHSKSKSYFRCIYQKWETLTMENDDVNQQDQPTDAPYLTNGGVIHSAVGDIHLPSSKIPFDMDFSFNPQTPITISSDQGYGVSTVEKGIQQPGPGFLKTAAAE